MPKMPVFLAMVLVFLSCSLLHEIRTYEVHFNLNYEGGSDGPPAQKVESGGLVKKPAAPEREGYGFLDWYREVACREKWNFGTDRVTEETHLYALWSANKETLRASGIVPSDEMGFRVRGGTVFAPQIILAPGGSASWTFTGYDGGTAEVADSVSSTPSVGYTGKMLATLTVTPWDALSGINLGYEADDGGTLPAAYLHFGGQNVAAVEHLNLAAPSLEVWCSSRNAGIQTLDFSGFAKIAAIECFLCTGLTSISLGATPALERLCVEDADLASLDVSASPSLTDLRGALNALASASLPAVSPENSKLRHICLRENEGLGTLPSFRGYAELAELLIWNAGQAGTLDLADCQKMSSVFADYNAYTGLDLGNTVFASAASVNLAHNDIASVNLEGTVGLHELVLYNNRITTIDLASMATPSIRHLDLSANALSAEAVEGVLAAMASWNVDGRGADFYIKLGGGTNAQLTEAAATAKASLAANGWTVTDNGAIP